MSGERPRLVLRSPRPEDELEEVFALPDGALKRRYGIESDR